MQDEKRFQRHLEKAKEWTLTRLRSKTAAALQHAIRAESGAYVGSVKCVVNGQIATVYSTLGEVVCVTCGAVIPWTHKGTHAGHFLGSRNAYIVLEEHGIHPQCAHCNKQQHGNPENYRIYMLDVYDIHVIEELERRKRGWTILRDGSEARLEPLTREELVSKRITYLDRAKAAEAIIKGGPPMAATKEETKAKPKTTSAADKLGQLIQCTPRQLTLNFDYEAWGMPDGDVLDNLAQEINTLVEEGRENQIEDYIKVGQRITEAKKKFSRMKTDEPWALYCKINLQMSASAASKAMIVAKTLGKKDLRELGGLPLSSLYKLCREGTSTKTRNEILKVAKTHRLTQKDVDAMMGDDKPEEETKSLPTIPTTHDEVKTFVQKKVNGLTKKLNGSPARDLIPDVLREIADELAAA